MNPKSKSLLISTIIIIFVVLIGYFLLYKKHTQSIVSTAKQSKLVQIENLETIEKEEQSVSAETFSKYKGPICCTFKDNVKIKTIKLPGNEETDVDIIMSIDGVSDARIQEINNNITMGVFDKFTKISDEEYHTIPVDVRLDKNTTSLSGELLGAFSIDSFSKKIVYADKDLVEYEDTYYIYWDGSAHASRTFDDIGLVYKNSNEDLFSKDANTKEYSSSAGKVLLHFYPNARSVIEKYYTDVAEGYEDLEGEESCIGESDTIEDFYPIIDPSNHIVVWAKYYPYALNGVCGSLDNVFIVPFSRLKEVEQYIPKDSILRKFMP